MLTGGEAVVVHQDAAQTRAQVVAAAAAATAALVVFFRLAAGGHLVLAGAAAFAELGAIWFLASRAARRHVEVGPTWIVIVESFRSWQLAREGVARFVVVQEERRYRVEVEQVDGAHVTISFLAGATGTLAHQRAERVVDRLNQELQRLAPTG